MTLPTPKHTSEIQQSHQSGTSDDAHTDHCAHAPSVLAIPIAWPQPGANPDLQMAPSILRHISVAPMMPERPPDSAPPHPVTLPERAQSVAYLGSGTGACLSHAQSLQPAETTRYIESTQGTFLCKDNLSRMGEVTLQTNL